MHPVREMKDLLKKIAKKCGFIIQRYDPRHSLSRCSLQDSMKVARKIGFIPKTVIDVGAARGYWSAEISSIWPESRYVLIDPLEENEIHLKNACRKIKHADYRISAITDHPGHVTINVHDDLEGSSIFLEREKNINGIPREIETQTVDEIVAQMRLDPPVLLKADVQGAETRVLLGATQSLPMIGMIILEVLLFDIYQGNSPQLFDTVSLLKSNGFVAWDIFGMGYRPLDEALCQIDMVFVREDGLFRKHHQYATGEQRTKQLAAIKKENPTRLKKR